MAKDWLNAAAPSLADFEILAAEAWNNMPAEFRNVVRDLLIRVEDFAPSDVLAQLGIEDPFELTGLYQGVSLDRQSVSDVAHEPDMVILYRRPILDEWAAGEEELGHLVAHVLIHEIGHHFGFSDEDMHAIEADATA
jgi:predicted Zn-dependent protease with MMP-like domain